MHQVMMLSHADAMHIVEVARAEIEKDGRGAAVAVVDAYGELLAFLRVDGCKLPSIQIAINKAYTAAREKRESRALGDASKAEGFPMTNFGELRYVSWGGGVPVMKDGVVVGGIGISGLPEADDMVIARKAAESLA